MWAGGGERRRCSLSVPLKELKIKRRAHSRPHTPAAERPAKNRLDRCDPYVPTFDRPGDADFGRFAVRAAKDLSNLLLPLRVASAARELNTPGRSSLMLTGRTVEKLFKPKIGRNGSPSRREALKLHAKWRDETGKMGYSSPRAGGIRFARINRNPQTDAERRKARRAERYWGALKNFERHWGS